MTHSLLKLALPLIVLFTIPLLLIRAQPYDDANLRAFLTPPDGCPAPCFMGIQPGVTTVRAGGDRLKTNPSIASIQAVSFQLYDVQFAGDRGAVPTAKVYLLATPDVRVERVNLFDTGIPLSRILLAFGRPSRMMVYTTIRYNIITFVAFYPEYQLHALVDVPLCSIEQAMLWSARRDVSLGIGPWRADAEQPDYYLFATEIQVDRWAYTLRNIRRERCP